MKWVEMIEMRLISISNEHMIETLRQLKREIGKKAENFEIKLFRRYMPRSDFSVFLLHQSDDFQPSGSSLGIRIVSALEEYCQVNHKIWIELENGSDPFSIMQ